MRRFFPALIVSAAIVLGSPYIGQLRGAVQAALPGQYRAIVAVIVALGVAAALAAAIVRIRERRALRYALVGCALVIAVAYAIAIRTGNVDQDLVEQFHFVQYGLVTFLFYRAWRWMSDGTAVLLPICAGAMVGVADETFQWFVPSRVGELHDVLINLVASVSGVLFSAGLEPPASFAVAADRARRTRLAGAAAATVLAVAAFVDAVHLGHEIGDAGTVFRSRYSPEDLRLAAADRAVRWPLDPPVTEPGIAREDHYLSEGQWHVQRRNEAAEDGDGWTAWHENRILETYYAPVLSLGYAWTAERRGTAAAGTATYVSDAQPYPMFVIHRWLFRTLALTAAGAILLLGIVRTPRMTPVAAI